MTQITIQQALDALTDAENAATEYKDLEHRVGSYENGHEALSGLSKDTDTLLANLQTLRTFIKSPALTPQMGDGDAWIRAQAMTINQEVDETWSIYYCARVIASELDKWKNLYEKECFQKLETGGVISYKNLYYAALVREKELRDQLTAPAQPEAKSRWLPIDTAPKDKHIYVAIGNEKFPRIGIFVTDDNAWYLYCTHTQDEKRISYNCPWKPTHWQPMEPLPPAPQIEEE